MTETTRRNLLALSITKLFCLAFILSAFAAVAPSQSPKLDPSFFGMWNLDLAKSDFASQPKPKSGQVNWGRHGWAFSIVFANDHLFTDAVMTDHGCVYVGAARLTCEYEILAPRHVRLTTREGKRVTRIGDIELLSDDVTQTTHHVTPSDGAPYLEKTIWVRQK